MTNWDKWQANIGSKANELRGVGASSWRETKQLATDVWKLAWVSFLGGTTVCTALVLGSWPVWVTVWWVCK